MDEIKKHLTKITIQLLRPLIRLLLRHNVSHAEFVEMARRAYVDVAYHDFSLDGKKKTISRAAVITGLSRKEVLRIRSIEDKTLPVERGPINRASRVMAGWFKDAEFHDAEGKARSLPIKGDITSFDALVKRYSGDITWGAVLDELIRVGAVKFNDINEVTPITTGYVPKNDILEKLTIMGECATDFIETLDHNLASSQAKPRYQRSVAYNYLTLETIAEFEQIATKKSNELLLDLNAWLAKRNCQKSKQKELIDYQRAGLGIYYFNNNAGETRYEE